MVSFHVFSEENPKNVRSSGIIVTHALIVMAMMQVYCLSLCNLYSLYKASKPDLFDLSFVLLEPRRPLTASFLRRTVIMIELYLFSLRYRVEQ